MNCCLTPVVTGLRPTSLPFGLGLAVSDLACRRRVDGTISGGRCRYSLRYVIPSKQRDLTVRRTTRMHKILKSTTTNNHLLCHKSKEELEGVLTIICEVPVVVLPGKLFADISSRFEWLQVRQKGKISINQITRYNTISLLKIIKYGIFSILQFCSIVFINSFFLNISQIPQHTEEPLSSYYTIVILPKHIFTVFFQNFLKTLNWVRELINFWSTYLQHATVQCYSFKFQPPVI